ncbi:xylose-binding protein [Gracilibacillus ureilyticus]|uniref:Xylose-binding protein n=1 Tax=Gracilibacillus ureilyticus TaxID=531814 RepID=A0A1H9VED0_9BACI|nr:substrate-binding domain-containing protein [Gracilibacillus ureilyticus]SES20035.1 xylose-binding protein [Gracilibacillus ureilyticus]
MKPLKWFTVLIFLFLIACSANDSNNDKSMEEMKLQTDEEKVYVGFAIDTLKEDRWYRDKEFVEKKVTELGGNIKTLAANGNQDVQIEQVKLLINEGIDVLIIVPSNSEAASKATKLAQESGVKVIAYDKLILGTPLDYYVSFDNEKVGEIQAQIVLDQIDEGNFAYIGGSETDNNAHLVRDGAMSILQPLIDSGKINLVYDEFTKDWSKDIAEENINKFLSSNTVTIDGIVTAYDGLAEGALAALGEQAGHIPISGQDAELNAIKRIIDGTQTGTVYKPIEALANQASILAMDIASGKDISTNATVNNGNMDVPTILLEPVQVTKENINETIIESGHYTEEEVYN